MYLWCSAAILRSFSTSRVKGNFILYSLTLLKIRVKIHPFCNPFSQHFVVMYQQREIMFLFFLFAFLTQPGCLIVNVLITLTWPIEYAEILQNTILVKDKILIHLYFFLSIFFFKFFFVFCKKLRYATGTPLVKAVHYVAI